MSDWKKVEAVLFVSGSYVDIQSICEYTNLSKKKALKAIEELKNHYTQIDSSLEVYDEENSYKLNVKKEFSGIVQEVISGVEMPKPIMETLALIAYKSPVMQSDIIQSRGAHCYEHIHYLENKKFISKERFGRTYKLKLTEKFHDYFDVDDSKIQSLFENIEKPEVPIEIKEEKEQNFEEKILDRMKREIPKESDDERDKFLNQFEEKLVGVQSRLDNAEEEIQSLKPKEEINQEEVESAFEEEKNTNSQ